MCNLKNSNKIYTETLELNEWKQIFLLEEPNLFLFGLDGLNIKMRKGLINLIKMANLHFFSKGNIPEYIEEVLNSILTNNEHKSLEIHQHPVDD